MKYQLCTNASKNKSMTIVCNIWMICFELIDWLCYDPSWMLHLSEFVWTLRSSVWAVFNNFLLIDATDRSKISINPKYLFFAVSYTTFHFSRTLPINFNCMHSLVQSGCTKLMCNGFAGCSHFFQILIETLRLGFPFFSGSI